jgi:hypothetical protein
MSKISKKELRALLGDRLEKQAAAAAKERADELIDELLDSIQHAAGLVSEEDLITERLWTDKGIAKMHAAMAKAVGGESILDTLISYMFFHRLAKRKIDIDVCVDDLKKEKAGQEDPDHRQTFFDKKGFSVTDQNNDMQQGWLTFTYASGDKTAWKDLHLHFEVKS